jgi:hypothetical protein
MSDLHRPRHANGTARTYSGGSTDRKDILARLPGWVIDLLETEVVEGEGDRSKHCFHTMMRLMDHGLTDDEVQLLAEAEPFARKYVGRGDIGEEISRARVKWEGREHDLREAADREWAKLNKIYPQPLNRTITAAELQRKIFTPIAYIVPDLIPEGLSMLAGRPKIGKSWLALDIALGVATPGGVCLGDQQPEHGDVLYCALEDSERRLQARISKLLGAYRGDWPSRLRLATEWKRLDKGGVADIASWVKSVQTARLVILDTLASVKPIRATSGYTEDYESLMALHRLANDIGIAVLVLHHQRKSDAEDPLDTISGTLGLAGCVDTPIILAGTSQGMTLYVRGRDVEEAERAVTFDKTTCRWTIVGSAAEVRMSESQRKILMTLKDSEESMGPGEIAAAVGLREDLVRQTLGRMVEKGDITKEGRGRYKA